MKRDWDFNVISKVFVSLIIFTVVVIVAFSLDKLEKRNKNNEAEIYQMINRALVQCYALEGAYPDDIFYLEKYGVNFDTDKYLYFYEPMGDFIPSVQIIDLDIENVGSGEY